MTGTRIDMHMHTVLGAYDSALQPARLAVGAREAGLSAVAITEHDRMWDAHVLRTFREEQADLLVVNGMEVSTDLGHILAFGLPGFAPGIHRIADLRRVADEVGGYLAVAHPFRYWYEPVHFTRRGEVQPEMVPDVLARTPVFEYVDAIEVLNGSNSDRENQIALDVAHYLGKPGIAGSDCHSETGIGCCQTLFERTIETPAQLVDELRAGRFSVTYHPPRES
jgi:predicted metal-dependent phosphoesterase TrpH